MSTPDAQSLIRSFALTQQIIELQTEGLSHEDSLLQLPFRGNCLNWVLGHILVGRNSVLALLGQPSIRGEAEISRYKSGSDPIVAGEGALSLDLLLRDLARSQQQITTALENTSPGTLAATIDRRGRQQSVGQIIAGLHWHETYHTGQLEPLRQLAGTDDAII